MGETKLGSNGVGGRVVSCGIAVEQKNLRALGRTFAGLIAIGGGEHAGGRQKQPGSEHAPIFGGWQSDSSPEQ
jgi:hypothetical protein